LTHYDLPLGGYVASCGCGGNSSYYPTAALSQAAYGSSSSSGPACGQCFNLTLSSAFDASPPYIVNPATAPNVVVKITDKCPKPVIYDADKTWCGATKGKPNKAGVYLHFDLSSPSPAIPLSFFPNASYGDYGAWLITFESVSCQHWAGYRNDTASIVDPSLLGIGGTGCCPSDPLVTNTTCAATSLKSGADQSVEMPKGEVLLLLLLGVLAVIPN